MKRTAAVLLVLSCLALLCAAPAGAQQARARGYLDPNSGQIYDTMVIAGYPNMQKWEIALPNGTYYLTVCCGDPQFASIQNLVVCEDDGQTLIPTTSVPAAQYLSVCDHQVTISDGALTLQVGGAGNWTKLNFLIIDSAPVQSATLPLALNFQPATINPTPLPAPWNGAASWASDNGQAFDDTLYYGWDQQLLYNGNPAAREKNINSNKLLDTFVFVLPSTVRIWNCNVPNGTYYVDVSAGDPQYSTGPIEISMEGLKVIDNQYIAKNSFYEIRNWITRVHDRNITMAVGSTTSAISNMINYVCIRSDKPSRNFPFRDNMQPATGYVEVPWYADGGYVYDATAGFGWSTSQTPVRRTDPAPGTWPVHLRDRLLLTSIYTSNTSPASWKIDDIPTGTYYVYAGCGDAQFPTGPHRVVAEPGDANEAVIVNDQSVAANNYYCADSVPVYVDDGELDIQIGGPASGATYLNYILVDDKAQTDNTPPAYFNFAPSYVSDPSHPSYTIDGGDKWDLTKGRGWNTTNIYATERNILSDKRLDTFIMTGSSTTYTWEVKIPNGTYNVTVSVGDPLFSTGPHRVVAESGTSNQKVLVNNVSTTAPTPYSTTTSVTVSDGYLTLTMGTGSANTCLNYVDIVP